MGLLKLKTKISVAEYLEGEDISAVKHEYIDGDVYAMAGANDNHNLIGGDIYIALGTHLRNSSCQPFYSDMKVRVAINIFYYPDILVSCEENSENRHFRNNPILVIEITSPSTERIDHQEKLLAYQRIQSVQEYIVIDQNRINIELHRRQTDATWITYHFDETDDEIEFQSVGLTMPISEIYRRVRFETNVERNN